ncbi:hypothetical protein J6590_009592 [Homalodisca vitripennis]|nr:hypothetical protein J6590_009592 [Homalodisca vitripennis]
MGNSIQEMLEILGPDGGTYRRLETEVHKAEYGNRLSSSTPHHFSSVFAYGASRSHRNSLIQPFTSSTTQDPETPPTSPYTTRNKSLTIASKRERIPQTVYFKTDGRWTGIASGEASSGGHPLISDTKLKLSDKTSSLEIPLSPKRTFVLLPQ